MKHPWRACNWIWSIAVAAIVMCASATQPISASPQATVQSAWLLADANKRFNVSGVVESVSYVSNSVILNAGGRHLEIEITPTTALELRGEAGSISDIRHGSKITASGVIRGGEWIANSVVVH